MTAYWQAKIWALLHDPVLKALHDNAGRGKEGAWNSLTCMEGWVSPKGKSLPNSPYSTQWLKHVGLCDLISSASDRAAIGRLQNTAVDYDAEGLQIRHLLSGEPLEFKLGQWHDSLMGMGKNRATVLADFEQNLIPETIRTCTDARKVYWWLWRCYPEVLSQAFDRDFNIPNEPCLPLLPADTRIPDASLWSHTTMTSALAGSLAGFYSDNNSYPKKGARKGKAYQESRPHLAIFSFTPVQELIKASRKMRDFWAGSWLLHYLSAKACWAIAWKYGPDSLVYPCLYQQPLIDLWLLEKYPQFSEWIKAPTERQLLTAGFPNVVVLILPDNGASNTEKSPVKAAMQQAEETIKKEWLRLGNLVLQNLQKNSSNQWQKINKHTWDDWLKTQWQTYWTALPIGNRDTVLHHSPRKERNYKEWQDEQNNFACPKKDLFVEAESEFLKATYESALREDWPHRSQPNFKRRQPNLNVGSWWASIFDQIRFALNAVKNTRTWELPTAFGPRSTVSGIGPVVHGLKNDKDWITEGETAKFWEEHAGLFDGIEELNATEVLKRGLHRILPEVLGRENTRLELYYPDLSSGVAGWLRKHPEARDYYVQVCEEVAGHFKWIKAENQSWGIPWILSENANLLNPRLLNAGWLIEDFEPKSDLPNQVLTKEKKKEKTQAELKKVRTFIEERFAAGNNPTDWYVLAGGDGDDMSSWLKGEPLHNYEEYLATEVKNELDKELKSVQGEPNKKTRNVWESFKEFLGMKKRMGPATHNALSRALLDFSNQLLPYLTEERYAGRLIYGGGDDVLAYTNLWEWDEWLWDIRECFRGDKDPRNEFNNGGHYWRWDGGELPKYLSERPLFTMGKKATISFGIVIAGHSVPLAIALENRWEAEDEAKEHESPNGDKKDAVQVRVIYNNGNVLKATAKFDAFKLWKNLISLDNLDAAIFEQVAEVWSQHPAPLEKAIQPWTQAFCSRREQLPGDTTGDFQRCLAEFIEALWDSTQPEKLDRQLQSWCKLAAFVIRKRDIKLGA
ncbi:type III-B CRISPR-associated protein Cas10/Cmr2 [Ancylothrix sp. C2]|uniref:type III-B CRISPR-associated protein Cas10/Cmr2 n=1 Tax=Ancylothrix sp. D3o TaxID=2953691 RepID=UPI0021BBA5B7|nr:type III-B CRISPR-associated protein Cas10/Cmr2 [Ancylothrix sp. D3o]MCT7952252.1 type III-B CRISPR-associated protein Cas10/Cmr2 [Ancylothrix sp. D3o]